MKKLILIFMCAVMILSLCACGEAEEEYVVSDKMQIVCSNFPAYDFTREIVGDRADITLLIKPGAEVHSYEPTPKDIIRIQNSALFVCNGGESEEWIDDLLDAPECENLNILYMMDCVDAVEESDEGIYAAEEEGEEEETELDEHVWTSPMNAVKICLAICEKMCEADPENAQLYNINTLDYVSELMELDSEIKEIVSEADCRTLVFADRFPMRYFTLEYGLEYYAAFPGCASETEPSAKTVAYLIDKVKENGIPAVLYMEFSNEKMADVICEDTGCKKLPFYSAHNISAEQFEAGMGYVDLMKINIESLREALS